MTPILSFNEHEYPLSPSAIGFILHWCKWGDRTFSITHNESLMEYTPQGIKEWKLVEKINNVHEIAMIIESNKHTQAQVFFNHSFPNRDDYDNDALQFYEWSGVFAGECGTSPPNTYHDKSHTRAKIIGITMAHKRVWEDFAHRNFKDKDKDNDKLSNKLNKNSYIIVFEHDAICERRDCGRLAIEQIRYESIHQRCTFFLLLSFVLFSFYLSCPPCTRHLID